MKLKNMYEECVEGTLILIRQGSNNKDLQMGQLVPFWEKQDKYTMDPGYSSLSQQKEKAFWSTKTNEKNA